MKLTYQPLENDDVLRVVCDGLVSTRGLSAGADPLSDLLGPHCYRQKVILNLERSAGADTSGLVWLARVAGRFASGHGRLVGYGLPATIRHMLDALGLASVVSTVATEQAALEAIGQPTAPPAGPTVIRPPTRTFSPPASDVG